MKGMGDPTKGWNEPSIMVAIASLCIAIAALAQPWIIALWKKFFSLGSVNIFNTGQIEIGYSNQGPTLGLHGTMIASDRNQLVHKVVAVVTRKKDGASHTFEWAFFRGYQVNLARPEDMTFELASGFLLTTSQPHRFNIFLIDFPVRDEIERCLRQLVTAWDQYSEAWEERHEDQAQPSDDTEANETNLAYEKFRSSTEHVNSFQEITRLCYWEPGDYKLQLTVETALPVRSFSRTWGFSLTNEDSDRLIGNTLSILSVSCIGDAFGFSFAYAKYWEDPN